MYFVLVQWVFHLEGVPLYFPPTYSAVFKTLSIFRKVRLLRSNIHISVGALLRDGACVAEGTANGITAKKRSEMIHNGHLLKIMFKQLSQNG
jgi:hypothetical protein